MIEPIPFIRAFIVAGEVCEISDDEGEGDDRPLIEMQDWTMRESAPVRKASSARSWAETPLARKQRCISQVAHSIFAVHDAWRAIELADRSLKRKALSQRGRAEKERIISASERMIDIEKRKLDQAAADLIACGFSFSDIVEWGLIGLASASVDFEDQEFEKKNKRKSKK